MTRVRSQTRCSAGTVRPECQPSEQVGDQACPPETPLAVRQPAVTRRAWLIRPSSAASRGRPGRDHEATKKLERLAVRPAPAADPSTTHGFCGAFSAPAPNRSTCKRWRSEEPRPDRPARARSAAALLRRYHRTLSGSERTWPGPLPAAARSQGASHPARENCPPAGCAKTVGFQPRT